MLRRKDDLGYFNSVANSDLDRAAPIRTGGLFGGLAAVGVTVSTVALLSHFHRLNPMIHPDAKLLAEIGFGYIAAIATGMTRGKILKNRTRRAAIRSQENSLTRTDLKSWERQSYVRSIEGLQENMKFLPKIISSALRPKQVRSDSVSETQTPKS